MGQLQPFATDSALSSFLACGKRWDFQLAATYFTLSRTPAPALLSTLLLILVSSWAFLATASCRRPHKPKISTV